MTWDGIERRKANKMSKDSFQPQTAFEGYVKASLDSIEKRFDNLPCSDQVKRIGKNEMDIANIKGKATILGIISGFVAGIFAKLFMK